MSEQEDRTITQADREMTQAQAAFHDGYAQGYDARSEEEGGGLFVYRAKCVKVVDGDTFDFLVDLGFNITHKIRVRLKGLDTPELRSRNEEERKHAKAATEYVRDLLLGKGGEKFPAMRAGAPQVTIRTEKDKLGIYGRYTASVHFDDGTHLKQLLALSGFEKKTSYPPSGQLGQ